MVYRVRNSDRGLADLPSASSHLSSAERRVLSRGPAPPSIYSSYPLYRLLTPLLQRVEYLSQALPGWPPVWYHPHTGVADPPSPRYRRGYDQPGTQQQGEDTPRESRFGGNQPKSTGEIRPPLPLVLVQNSEGPWGGKGGFLGNDSSDRPPPREGQGDSPPMLASRAGPKYSDRMDSSSYRAGRYPRRSRKSGC